MRVRIILIAVALLAAVGCQTTPPAPPPAPEWELQNPIVPLPAAPFGIHIRLNTLPNAPTPERVRLGRWLFYDGRLSKDGSVSCGTCHRPEYAFSEPTPVSTGIGGQKGGRKAPSVVNQAEVLYPHFFWDGRASSLEEQALGPVENPIEMGNTHEAMVQTLTGIAGYRPYFEQAFGTPEITKQRIAQAIADYERTRMSGNSPWDRWKIGRDEQAVSAEVKAGHDLFFGKAGCNQCHVGQSFTDNTFHNLGVGWDEKAKAFKDLGRGGVTKNARDEGAFKTPSLRDCSKHAPYMHDGSVATLHDVVVLYARGGHRNPNLDPKIQPIALTDGEIDAIVKMLEALDGEGYQDTPPTKFPM